MSKRFEDAAREVALWDENESERSRPIQVTHCIDCRYWDTLENGNGWCKCPRVFPGKTVGTITARIGFYLTSENDFCSSGGGKSQNE